MLIHPDKSLLLVIDIQEKLVPAIYQKEQLVDNCKWLLEIANVIGVPVMASEQYPQGLGHTVPAINDQIDPEMVLEKLHFSCMSEPECNRRINEHRPDQVILIGMEAHVCVLQTAMQLKQQAREVFVVADCVSSRSAEDKSLALDRLRANGIHIVSREMVAFEWMQKSGTDQFKKISKEYLR